MDVQGQDDSHTDYDALDGGIGGGPVGRVGRKSCPTGIGIDVGNCHIDNPPFFLSFFMKNSHTNGHIASGHIIADSRVTSTFLRGQ